MSHISHWADGTNRFYRLAFSVAPNGHCSLHRLWNWDFPGLRSAVHLDGTLNNNQDRDRGWTVELALPWAGFRALAAADGRALPPRNGDVWRMDFSRFNQYKAAPPAQDSGSWAWSLHGVWDSHIPELFTHVHFSTEIV